MPRRAGVEVAARADESQPWQVSGVSRGAAQHLVSTVNGGPAYGGTPNDAAVLAAIADLKARGLAVTLYPLMMMDIPAGNGLPDPYGASQQAAYPWRGTHHGDGGQKFRDTRRRNRVLRECRHRRFQRFLVGLSVTPERAKDIAA